MPLRRPRFRRAGTDEPADAETDDEEDPSVEASDEEWGSAGGSAGGEAPRESDEIDLWAPIPLEPAASPARRVLQWRAQRIITGGLVGVLLVLLVSAGVLYAGERSRRQQLQGDLRVARQLLAIAEADRTAALERAARAATSATGAGDQATLLSDVARRLEAALRDELALQDLAVRAINDAGAAFAAGNTQAVNDAIDRLNRAVADQQRKLGEIRLLLDEFEARRAELG